MTFTVKRAGLPQALFPILPFLMFFPSGLRSTGVLLFLIATLVSGNYGEKWGNVRRSPMFWPALAMLGVSVLAGMLLDRSAERFWNGFAHYQIYLFLLLFISMGSGEWQRRASWSFAIGALCAATLFYLKAAGLLPEGDLFQNYLAYAGNNSILLGILLALAAGVFLYEAVAHSGRIVRLRSFAAFLYVTPALLLLAKTRTGVLLFVVLCSIAVFQAAVRSWRKALGLLVLMALILAAASQYSTSLQERARQTMDALHGAASAKPPAHRDIRLELYDITMQMIAEKPLTGHGIAQWMPLYQQRALGLASEKMATPHNDYLLYAAELGAAGLAALLCIWVVQLVVALRMGGRAGTYLGMLTIAMIIGAMFNAILRDAVFGLPFMILLAIPLAGVEWPARPTAAAAAPVNARGAN